MTEASTRKNSKNVDHVAYQARTLAENRRIEDEDKLIELLDKCVPIYSNLYNLDEEEQRQVKETVLRQMNLHMDTGVMITCDDHKSWYLARKRELDMRYTDRNLEYLSRTLPDKVIRTLDGITDEIMDSCGNPNGEREFRRRGLVIGDVQSGKTNTYTMLCCKAADTGYNVIILLTGTLENLRRQTQRRMDLGFTGRDSDSFLKEQGLQNVGVGEIDDSVKVVSFTSVGSDFKQANMQNNGLSLETTICPILLVIKKNSSILKNLHRWLYDNNVTNGRRIDRSLLLIDDEADNASINTKLEDVTAVNQRIREILNLFTQSTYIGFTATPFANIFIDPESKDEMGNDDLFPKDFIYSLGVSSNYIGPSMLFSGTGVDKPYPMMLKNLDDAEDYIPSRHRKEFIIQELPPSLKEAIECFALSCVIRDLRGRNKDHMSMLVNVSRFTDVQESVKEKVGEFLYNIQRNIRTYAGFPQADALKNASILSLKNTFEKQYGGLGYSWKDIQKSLCSSVNSIVVRSINQKNSARNLAYSDHEDGLRIIAVGGNSLSRGLTLEGLAVSYFRRDSRTYDTLMQMGRWFGYRDGYADLCRIWMSEASMLWYRDISAATDELKEEICRMHNQNKTPSEFGLLVRNDIDGLQITSRAKMRHASDHYIVKSVAGKLVGTDHVYVDLPHVNQNREAVENFIASLEADGLTWFQNNTTDNIACADVPGSHIARLLCNFKSPRTNQIFDTETLKSFVEKLGDDRKWDVCIRGGKGANSTYALPHDIREHPTVYRSMYTIDDINDGTSIRFSRGGFASPHDTIEGLYMTDDMGRHKTDNRWAERLKEQYKKNYSPSDGEPIKNVPARAYLQDEHRNPLLIIYRFDIWGKDGPGRNEGISDEAWKADLQMKTQIHEDLRGCTPIGLGLGFPLPKGGFDNMDSDEYKVRYKANLIYEKLGEPEYDEDEEYIDE